MSETYKVVLSGSVLPGFERDSVREQVMSLFKLDEAKADAMLSGKPVVVKKDLDGQKADAFRSRLESVGLECEVRPMAGSGQSAEVVPPPAPPSASDPAAGPMKAPDAAPANAEWQSHGGYEFMLEGQPDYAFLNVRIPQGETLKVEASSMATMDTHLSMKTKLGGGFKRFLSGESIFINEFTATDAPAEIGIAPATPGDMGHVYLDNDTVYLQNSAYVASSSELAIETKWQGLVKGFFSGEGLFLIRATGTGDLWFNTYGGIIEIDVDGDYVVDNHHIVAFTHGLDYNIEKIGGYKSLFFSGEGLVCRFRGQGKVWIQTRKARALISWAYFYRPVKKRG